MADRLAEIREVAARDYEEVRSLIQGLPADALPRKTSNGWTVGQLASHIAGSPKGHAYVIGRLRKGGNATVPGPLAFIVNVMNWNDARKFKNTSKPALLAAAERSYNDYTSALDGLSEDELDRGGDVLGLGKMTLYEYLMRSGDHGREHAADLRQAAGV